MIGTTEGLIAYAAARGVVITEEEAPVLLTKAGDYLHTKCWYGQAYTDEDVFPRTGLVYDGSTLLDINGDVIATIDVDGEPEPIEKGDVVDDPATPKSIVNAAYRLAMEIGNGVDLMPTVSGAQVLQERVEGAVTVQYAESTIGTPLSLPWLNGMIGPWMSCSQTSGINFPVMRG